MRLMSFSLTTKQFKARTKHVTRRLGWNNLKPGDVVMGCEKCMGLKKGLKVKKLHAIVITRNTREKLVEIYGHSEFEVAREGFPKMTKAEFITIFCRHNHCTPKRVINRIEFRHL